MKRSLVLAGLPLLVLGLILLLVAIFATPMIPLVSNDQQSIPRSDVADYYYYAYWPVPLSASQRTEFQFSATQPVDFVIFDSENYNRFVNNQTFTALASALSERQSTHIFTPAKSDTFYFFLQNTSTLDVTVTVTIRSVFTSLAYIGAGFLVVGGVLMTLGSVLKPRAVDIPTRVLEVIMMHGHIKVSELALRFSTSETDIEMALLKLRSMGHPINYDRSTGEVSYGSPPFPPQPQPPPSTTT